MNGKKRSQACRVDSCILQTLRQNMALRNNQILFPSRHQTLSYPLWGRGSLKVFFYFMKVGSTLLKSFLCTFEWHTSWFQTQLPFFVPFAGRESGPQTKETFLSLSHFLLWDEDSLYSSNFWDGLISDAWGGWEPSSWNMGKTNFFSSAGKRRVSPIQKFAGPLLLAKTMPPWLELWWWWTSSSRGKWRCHLPWWTTRSPAPYHHHHCNESVAFISVFQASHFKKWKTHKTHAERTSGRELLEARKWKRIGGGGWGEGSWERRD